MLLHHQAIEGLRRALHSRSASSRHRRYPSSCQLSKRISLVLPSSNYLTVLTRSKIQVLATIRQLLYFNATHRAWFLKTRLIFTTAIKNHIADSFNVYLRLLCTPFISTKLRSALYRVQPRQPIPTSPG